MHVSLIQTPLSEASYGEFREAARKHVVWPPLGLLYLAGAVEKAGCSASIIDLEAEQISFDVLCNRIAQQNPGLIGLNSTTPVFENARRLASALRTRFNIPIVLGGAHGTVVKAEALTPEFDFCVYQEGEATLVELLKELQGGKKFDLIPGLIFRESGKRKVNPPRPWLEDIDLLPLPARHLINNMNYRFEVPGKGIVPSATIQMTRGCPFKCVFCSEPLNMGRKLRKRTPANIVREMITAKEQFGLTHFWVVDSTLTLNRQGIEEMCRELIARKAEITWEGNTRANLVDEPLLELMKTAGLVRLSFGVESANPMVLKLIRKEVDPVSMRAAFRLCKKTGVVPLCTLMMGNPGDTRKTIMETARFVRSIPELGFTPLGIALPYPGTELHDMAAKNKHGLKLLATDYAGFSRYSGGVMEVDGMSPGDLARLQRLALVVIHSTPHKIISVIRHFGLRSVAITAFLMAKNMVRSWFGYRNEPKASEEIIDGNTTLQNMATSSDRRD